MIPSKTIPVYTQDGATHLINCTRPIISTKKGFRIKNTGLALEKCYSYRNLATSIYKYYKKLSQSLIKNKPPEKKYLAKKNECLPILNFFFPSQEADWFSRPKIK